MGLLSILGIDPVGKVLDALTAAYKAKLDSKTDVERADAELSIMQLEAQRDIILQAQRDRFERWVRLGFALPFMLYINKLVVWDKVLGWGSTDPLSDLLTSIAWTVIGGYFLLGFGRAVRK